MCVSVGSILPVVRWEGGFAAKNARRCRGAGRRARAQRASRRWGDPATGTDRSSACGDRLGRTFHAGCRSSARGPSGAHELDGLIGDRVGLSPSRPRGDVGGVCQVRGARPAVLSRRPVSSSARRWGGRGIRGEEGEWVSETPPGGSGRDRGGRGAAEIGTRASRGARAPAWRRRFFERLARATAARRTGRAEIRRLPGAASTDARDATRVNSTGRGRSEGERATGARGMAVCVAGACAFPTARRHDF